MIECTLYGCISLYRSSLRIATLLLVICMHIYICILIIYKSISLGDTFIMVMYRITFVGVDGIKVTFSKNITWIFIQKFMERFLSNRTNVMLSILATVFQEVDKKNPTRCLLQRWIRWVIPCLHKQIRPDLCR